MCHQIPTRVISISGGPLPVCARDTGLYLGFFVSFVFLWAIDKGKRNNELPSKGVLVLAILAIIALALDGITSYSGLRDTTNAVRLITGLSTGFALPLLLFPIFNYQLWKRSSYESVLLERWQKILALFVVIMTFVLIQIAQRINIQLGAEIFSTLVAVSIIFTFLIINLILLTLIPLWYQKADRLSQLSVPVILALILAIVELSLSSYAHRYLISLVL